RAKSAARIDGASLIAGEVMASSSSDGRPVEALLFSGRPQPSAAKKQKNRREDHPEVLCRAKRTGAPRCGAPVRLCFGLYLWRFVLFVVPLFFTLPAPARCCSRAGRAAGHRGGPRGRSGPARP